MLPILSNIPIQKINSEVLTKNGISLFIKREDLIHPVISGNKWRKLKYNLLEAKRTRCQVVVTFGGAFSNHIAATAAAGHEEGFSTHGIIRGEKMFPLNPTLLLAQKNGMEFTFVSRDEYKSKIESKVVQTVIKSFDKPFVIPEGGSNSLGVLGCEEIINSEMEYDVFVTACGTGSTLSGIINGMNKDQYAIGFPALKNAGFLNEEVNSFLKVKNENWHLELDYHFGGYAKNKPELVEFIREFWIEYNIKLDPIYTSKAMFGLLDLIEKGVLKNKRVLFIHTGGLQGVSGFEARYEVSLFPNKQY
jgi:1-aminocyclopropane-1-carboxylate deaminase/D-cysteine desulfhydrase-like pyridoxal-dependent ACC family enzyme